MSSLTCGFIGLGLIGGSIAKALKENITGIRILAYDINEDALNAAYSDQVADLITHSIDKNFTDCDYIFLCAPVGKNDENLLKIRTFLSPGSILTDVGSVKANIHEQVARLGLSGHFIGGHPMTGSERIGYLNSKPGLLENAYYIMTPTADIPPEKITAYQTMIQKIGAIPLILDYHQHDYITAAISHLPHVIAASLVNLVRDSDAEDGLMKMIAAGGFKDITRIASSSAVMWQQICLTNTENISVLLDAYINTLNVFKEQLDGRDEEKLLSQFEQARIYRDSFIDTSSGPIKKSYSLNIDIADEPGALAAIATILALNNISIKNIGIVHNRELEEGVLRIEFYEETAVAGAKHILNAKGYLIHEKK